MLTEDQLLFRQGFCRATACGRIFFVCSRCDHNQAYCSDACRLPAFRRQRRAANRRHQQSEEGRLDHRDRSRAYRLRQAQLSRPLQIVTDHSSIQPLTYDTVSAAPVTGSELVTADPNLTSERPSPSDFRLHPVRIVCGRCGRSGLLINPFVHLE
jgi:hypothetical protein